VVTGWRRECGFPFLVGSQCPLRLARRCTCVLRVLEGRLWTLPPPAIARASGGSADWSSANLSRLGGGERDCLSAARGRPAGPSEREPTSQSPSCPPSAVLLRRTGTRQGLPWRLAWRGSERACGIQFRDTAQRGRAATPGARVCDPQQLAKARLHAPIGTAPACGGGCGSQTRAPLNRRNLRRFRQILIECNSALRGPYQMRPA
jgi:hypothetical protein